MYTLGATTKLDEKQKSLINSPFFCSEFQSVSRIVKIVLVRSAFGAIWEDPEGGFIKFTVKRASKQDRTLHMEGKLHAILYFREEC